MNPSVHKLHVHLDPQEKAVKPILSLKALLASTESSVIAEFAQWRKAQHYLHANALAQNYFLATEEWSVLRGKTVVLEKTTYSLQSIVAKQTMKNDPGLGDHQ